MTRHVALYIKDILSSMRDTEQFIEGMSYQQFLDDKNTFNAVVRAIEIIGEAAKNVPTTIRAQYPAIPFPSLKPTIEQILKDLHSAGT